MRQAGSIATGDGVFAVVVAAPVRANKPAYQIAGAGQARALLPAVAGSVAALMVGLVVVVSSQDEVPVVLNFSACSPFPLSAATVPAGFPVQQKAFADFLAEYREYLYWRPNTIKAVQLVTYIKSLTEAVCEYLGFLGFSGPKGSNRLTKQ
ncbi:hypothetical protein DIPPA_21814 [Diplonema papillatum]|nr:hypothetical protein DIPPA_21814 [Diplonema papillatum]